MRVATIASVCCLLMSLSAESQKPLEMPLSNDVLAVAKQVNSYMMKKVPDPTAPSFVGQQRPSNIWTRAVYYEGLMDLYSVYPDNAYFDYTYKWGKFHDWSFRGGDTNRNADDYAAAQIYMDMHELSPNTVDLRHVNALVNMIVNGPSKTDWYWIDALHMGMPVLAKYARMTSRQDVLDKMWDMYNYTRSEIGNGGLFNTRDKLWHRDVDYLPPYKESNGKPCFWSRGNAWVLFALTRVIDNLPEPILDVYGAVKEDFHRMAYLDDFQAMCKALLYCQRVDGFWNPSLLCEANHGGMETSGTALIVASIAWGIRTGNLPLKMYNDCVIKGWNALVANSVRQEGSLGYVQGTGKSPSDGMPISATSTPDFEDFGIGCFLLAASEMYKISVPKRNR